ncbi:cyclic nucleotide-binding domain-containing protein [Flavivirga aquimarina]|uniref:Cyclic nucleotide-binding domain-containing protein n=1 Tax=Flavivirga aquimarina TaxID=2027862 RepID=A0ABT8WAV3_9FLAO|nr:cyclic nucleotide-binding domain-containing protein [Flavivirga aquimarina]MDO5970152.1 cyclic nucleotide-binding domain-containing protein [Flavivirga aquimarina]
MTFLEFFNRTLNISTPSYEDLPFPVKKSFLKKGEIVTEYGQVEDSLYFMNRGIAEITIKSYVSEKIIDFFFEKEFFCCFTSFLNQQPGDVRVMALMDCDVEVIKREDLMQAYNDSFDVNKFGRIMTEHGYIRKSNREKALLTKTAEEIYVEMFKNKPDYISNIPVNKIAKYLGIHPESLSRIRKKIHS